MLDSRRAFLAGVFPHASCSSAGETIVAYLTAVLTDLLHTQRDPLALCLLLQAYDKFEPQGSPCCQQLSLFSRYYSLWIPEQAREARVSCSPCSCQGGLPWPAVWLELQGEISYPSDFLTVERKLSSIPAAALM